MDEPAYKRAFPPEQQTKFLALWDRLSDDEKNTVNLFYRSELERFLCVRKSGGAFEYAIKFLGET